MRSSLLLLVLLHAQQICYSEALTTPTLVANSRHSVLSRRSAISAIATALAAPPSPVLADELPAEANFLVPTPLGIISYGLSKQADKQEACYEAGECLDKVPYYQLECDRSDSECLARRRRLASKEIDSFLTDPSGSPALLVYGLFFLGGPFAAVTRAIVAVSRQLLGMPPPPPPPPPPPAS